MAAAPQPSQGPPAAKIPLRMRLKAWWEGYDLTLKESGAEQGAATAPREAAPLAWNEARIAMSQKIWGEGFTIPGESSYILGLVQSLGLTPAMSVLELGAGLGGAGRVMAQNFGCWVTALEADEDLAEAGNEISVKSGLAKKCPVESFDPDSLSLKENAYDCAFSNCAFFTFAAKDDLLKQVDRSLKEKGQLLFTDFVKAEEAGTDAAIATWAKGEPIEPQPWSPADYTGCIEAMGYDVRVVEDISDRFKSLILQGWAEVLSSLEATGLDHATGAALVSEVELWTRRTQAIESGHLRVCRIHALKSGSSISVSEI